MMTGKSDGSWISRLWRQLTAMIVQEVPDELAACEFCCREPDCRMGDWENCERRKAYEP
jgi:hypothetical protein